MVRSFSLNIHTSVLAMKLQDMSLGLSGFSGKAGKDEDTEV